MVQNLHSKALPGFPQVQVLLKIQVGPLSLNSRMKMEGISLLTVGFPSNSVCFFGDFYQNLGKRGRFNGNYVWSYYGMYASI